MKILKCILWCACVLSASAYATESAPAAAPAETSVVSDKSPAPAASPAPMVNNDLEITDAYVQPLIPGQKNTAAYMRISNHSQERYVLIGVSTSMAQQAQIHTVVTENGIMKMREVGSILLLPNEEVLLQPGNLHVMLMGVSELNKDSIVPLCLEFQDSADICLDVPVRDKRGEKANADAHAH